MRIPHIDSRFSPATVATWAKTLTALLSAL